MMQVCTVEEKSYIFAFYISVDPAVDTAGGPAEVNDIPIHVDVNQQHLAIYNPSYFTYFLTGRQHLELAEKRTLAHYGIRNGQVLAWWFEIVNEHVLDD